MQKSNKRKKTILQNDTSKKSKQTSLSNFFAPPKKELIDEKPIKVKAEPISTELEIEEVVEQTNDEKEFYTDSMYTDEFNNMLETVLENESFLFTEKEIGLFNTYRSLKGNFF